MTNELITELRQTKPFQSLAQEAHLSVIRTGAVLLEGIERLLKPYGISATQYNVLRILRGAGQDGLCRNEIRDRLINRMPDVSRLLDRMEEAGLVARERDAVDRRLVTTRLAERGTQLVNELDALIDATHDQQLGHMSEKELRELLRLLALARSKS
jgi:DNA-binding MarR family transcriptional regulator